MSVAAANAVVEKEPLLQETSVIDLVVVIDAHAREAGEQLFVRDGLTRLAHVIAPIATPQRFTWTVS